MLKVYPAVFHEEEGFWVEFPDLPGCQSCGATLEESFELASEALGLYLSSLSENGQPYPAPSPLSSFVVDDGFASLIAVDVSKYRRNTKAVKKTLSIPAWLAEEAERHNVSLSKVLQDGLKERFGY